MKCNECLEMMDQAIELELTADQNEAFQEHLVACPNCREEMKDLQCIMESLGDMPMKPLPENFKEELHEKLVESQKKQKKSKIKSGSNWAVKHSKQLSIAAAVVLILAMSTTVLPSLLSGNDESVAYNVADSAPQYAGFERAESPAEMPSINGISTESTMKSSDELFTDSDGAVNKSELALEYLEAVAPPETQDTLQGRKVIQRGNMELEVKVYDDASTAIKAMVQGSGGFVQDMSEYYYFGRDGETQLKAGTMTIRIPAIQFDMAYDSIKDVGKAVSQSANAQDISSQYRDVYNEKLNLEVREEQLRGIMAKAERIEDIIIVESELSRVRGQINSMAGTLQQWDQLISLATITINMREVEDFTTKVEPIKKDLWTKAQEAFNASLNNMKWGFENLIIRVIASLPQWILSFIGLLFLFFFGRFLFKKIKKWSVKK